jgi:hypothetical protein
MVEVKFVPASSPRQFAPKKMAGEFFELFRGEIKFNDVPQISGRFVGSEFVKFEALKWEFRHGDRLVWPLIDPDLLQALVGRGSWTDAYWFIVGEIRAHIEVFFTDEPWASAPEGLAQPGDVLPRLDDLASVYECDPRVTEHALPSA